MAILTGMSGGPEACSFGSFAYLYFAVPNAPLAAWWMAANASFLMAVVARYVLPALVATAGIGYFGRTDSAKAVGRSLFYLYGRDLVAVFRTRAAESARHGVLGRLPDSSAQWCRLRFFNRLFQII